MDWRSIERRSRSTPCRKSRFRRPAALSARRLFEEVFPPDRVTVEAFGNVLSVVASLQGMAAEELRPEELDYRDE